MWKKFWPIWIASSFWAAGAPAEEVRVETDNFALQAQLPESQLEEWGELLEQRRREIADGLSFYYLGRWDKKCEVRFAASAREFAAKSGAPAWARGWSRLDFEKSKEGIAVTGRAIWMRSDLRPGEMEPLFSHEVAHLLYREFVEFPPGLPLWLDEGVAVWAEERSRPEYDRVLRTALSGRGAIPLKSLLNMKEYPADKSLFYSQASSIIQYLISEFGAHEFQRFSRLIRDGMPAPQALEQIYGVDAADPAEFEMRWQEWALARE